MTNTIPNRCINRSQKPTANRPHPYPGGNKKRYPTLQPFPQATLPLRNGNGNRKEEGRNSLFFLVQRRPPRSNLFPFATLLRSRNYGTQLAALIRRREPGRAVDRLLVAGLIEARSCERFDLLRKHVDDVELADFYGSLFESEAGHHADRKSTRLNSSHALISYVVFCLKKKNI